MNKRRLAAMAWIVLAMACFIMGFLSLAGVVSRADTNERLVFGIGWILIGAGWLARYFFAKRKWERQTEEDRGSPGEGGM